MSDVHAFQDLFAFLAQVVVVTAQVAADGKVSIADLATLYQLLAPAQKVVTELKDLGTEAKELDAAGLKALAPQLIDLGAQAVAAVESLPFFKAAVVAK